MNYYRNPTTNEVFGYDPETQKNFIDKALAEGWIDITGSYPPSPTDNQLLLVCKLKAQSLLQATDWSTLPDVTLGTPKLLNQQDFFNYRNQVRILAINPVTNPIFPVEPTEQWSN
jgi:hypothetical protein